MLCVELVINGKRTTVAGGLAVRSIDSRFFFFPATGRGSFGMAGYSDSGSDPPERLRWAGGDLKVGDEFRLRIVESDIADVGDNIVHVAEGAEPPGPMAANAEKTCLFCQKTNREPDFFMSSNAGSICGECIRRAAQFMEELRRSGKSPPY